MLTIFKEYEFERFSENATFYIFESKSYEPNDWNHGVIQYMAKNEELHSYFWSLKCGEM